MGCAEDVDRAVAAAAAAGPAWAALTLDVRIAHLERIADAVAAHAGELAELQCREMGKPLGLGRTFIDNGVAALRGSVAEARTYAFDTTTRHDDGSTTRSCATRWVSRPWSRPGTSRCSTC